MSIYKLLIKFCQGAGAVALFIAGIYLLVDGKQIFGAWCLLIGSVLTCDEFAQWFEWRNEKQ